MEAIETLTKGNRILRIYQDETPDSPRQWDNLSKFILSHKRYDLPNELKFNFESFDNLNDCEKELKKLGAVIIKSVRCYEHSGFSISLSNNYPYNDYWDSGNLGFIVVMKEDIIKEFGKFNKNTLKKAEQILLSEFMIYKDYLEGNVYGFELIENVKVKITKEYTKERKEVINTTEEKNIDSCFGFFGDDGIKQIKKENKFS